MPWFFSTTCKIRAAAASPGISWFGPYPSRAGAVAAARQAGCQIGPPPRRKPKRGLSGTLAAADFLRFRGHPYIWGAWDCSGALNHVLGEDMGIAIPGYRAGAYSGPPPHGPVVLDYVTWDGAVTIAPPAAPGDLCIWTGGPAGGHIGMAISATRMISALDPAQGTAITPIDGTGPPGPFMLRRVLALSAGGGPVPVPAPRPGHKSAAGLAVLARLALLALLGTGAVILAVLAVGAVSGAITASIIRRPTRARF